MKSSTWRTTVKTELDDLAEGLRPSENAPARHRADAPVDSVQQFAQDSGPARHKSDTGAAVADPASVRPDGGGAPAHVADNVGDTAAQSDHLVAPTDQAPVEHAEAAPAPVDQNLHGTSHGVDTSDVLSRSRLSADELASYLKATDPQRADQFARTGVWPEDIQVPKDASVLDEGGRIDWDQVPKGGYLLDKAGSPIKEPYVPEIGEVIDRYGPADGRYTSPVLGGSPYPYGQRSLPYVEDATQYHQYVVTGDFNKIQHAIDMLPDKKLQADINEDVFRFRIQLEAHRGPVAPGFGGSGGAVQIELPLKVEFMKALGMIAEK